MVISAGGDGKRASTSEVASSADARGAAWRSGDGSMDMEFTQSDAKRT